MYDVSTQARLPALLPDGSAGEFFVGGEIVDREARQFVFFPNGSSHGGSIALTGGRGSVSYAIRLEPLTGKIQVVPGARS